MELVILCSLRGTQPCARCSIVLQLSLLAVCTAGVWFRQIPAINFVVLFRAMFLNFCETAAR